MIVLVISSGVQNSTLGFDKLGFDFNRVFESSLYRVLVGAWCVGDDYVEECDSTTCEPPGTNWGGRDIKGNL